MLLQDPTRISFFTGKGGVGKTVAACASAIALAEAGKRVLLISTDPASNLDEVLGVKLSHTKTPVPGLPGLWAINIDPLRAAEQYRERVVGPYRGLLPEAAIHSIEEQLSGACTVEIAAFDEFSKWLSDASATSEFDHLLFDTAPTGHTLRLLELPSAWSGFIADSVHGASCLGPLAGLTANQVAYAACNSTLRDAEQTQIVLVARPDAASLREAERTRSELQQLGIHNLRLILNGIFTMRDPADPTARALARRAKQAIDHMPNGLQALARTELPLLGFGLVGVDALRKLNTKTDPLSTLPEPTVQLAFETERLEGLVDRLAQRERGVVMTMGKGGVGKTTLAARIAAGLARRGLPVTLTTTDPAAHVEQALAELRLGGAQLRVTRIDPELETRRYREQVLNAVGATLDAAGLALVEEDLRSPCTEEIAVFRAFAQTVAEGEQGFVVIDTAPTGHTLLLLDATEAYHREVLRKPSASPEAVQRLLPRLRDAAFTHVLIVTLAEATPLHEAMQLERDLARARITPYAWIVNQSLIPLAVSDPLLCAKRALEASQLTELAGRAARVVIEPWLDQPAG